MRLTNKQIGYLLIVLSGIFWGTGFLYIQYILDYGLAAKDLVSWKMIFGFIILFTYIMVKDKSLLKVGKKGLLYMAFMAIFCHILYNLSMYSAIKLTNIATTVSLMYTAPIFVLLIARILFKELLTRVKVIGVILCVLGAVLTATGGSLSIIEVNVVGVLLGLFCGLCYAIMNIMSKVLLKTYNQLTILTYTFGLAFLFSLTFSNPLAAFELEFNPWFWLNIILLGVVPTTLAYFLFTTGLSYKIESSKAAIIATIEVPVSVLGSYAIFGQEILGWKLVGIALILLSVTIIQGDLFPEKKSNLRP